MITTKSINHIEAAIQFVRACGPVTEESIANEIRNQVAGADKPGVDVKKLAKLAVQHGLDRGWLESYDEESFCMA